MAPDPTKHLLIGTAGHVDHGKTALIRTLTGIDTDRLEEEQERGISIVLGFAPYTPESEIGARVGIVDVPGHERFIKTMVAGATGVDVALFVVACDEGVKPQTHEHLEILTLLGVRHGVIALTKLDLVEDAEWVELVKEEVKDLVAPTFLAESAMIPVSSTTGEGLDALRAALDDVLLGLPERATGAGFRLPIDRSFTIKGIGTVVTGSVWTGAVGVGNAVQLQPSGQSTRVREIQQHGETVESTAPGTRSAIALHGVSVEEAAPGMWIVTPGSLQPTRTVDLEITHLPSAPAPLEHNQRIRVHHGTQEAFGRLRLLGADTIPPGAEGFAQLHLEESLVPAVGDRLLLRRYSPMRTIAGATILDVNPPRHRRHDEGAVESLQVRAEGDPLGTVDMMVRRAGLNGVPLNDALHRSGLSADSVKEAAGRSGWVLREEVLIDARAVENAVESIGTLLDESHNRHPLKRGLSAEAIAVSLGVPAGGAQMAATLERAEAEGMVERDPPFWRRTGFEVRFEGALKTASDDLVKKATQRETMPWSASEADTAAREALQAAGASAELAPSLLEALEQRGDLIRYPGAFVLHASGHEQLVAGVRDHFGKADVLSVGDFRELSGGLTRKFAIPILEYFDNRGYTTRQGDARLPGPKLD
jgi:selenocysteine-specific elongation factor